MAGAAMLRTLGRVALVGACAGVGLGVGLGADWSAMAQNSTATTANAPPRLVFDVSTTLDADSNRNLSRVAPDKSLRFGTQIGFAFDSRTRLDQLQISGSGLFRENFRGLATGSGLQQPRLRFAYARDTGNAKLSVTASRSQSDVDGFDTALLPDGTLATGIPRSGTVTDQVLGLSLQTGVNDPVGFILSVSESRRDYSQTTDPAVFDTARQSLSFTTRLTVSPQTRVDLVLATAETEDDNLTQTNRRDRSVSVRLDQALSPILTLQTAVGYSQNTRDALVLGLPVRQQSEGLFGQVGFSLQRPNGTASVSLDSARDVSGVRNTFSVGRNLDLAGGGELAADLGLTARSGGDADLVGSLRYLHPLPTGQITASLDRSVTLDAANADVTATRLALSYTYEITEISQLSFSADYSETSSAAIGGTDTTRTALRATYTRDLTPDWQLDTGVHYRELRDNAGRASSNSVFVTVRRSFIALP